MLQNVLYIFEGYIKLLYDVITFHTSYKVLKRTYICNKCEFNKHGVCSLCGCILKAKVRVDFLEDEDGITLDGCPERKW